jgi:flagellar motility protein MotE (MotC chaperone)
MKRSVVIILVLLFLAVNVQAAEDVAGVIEKQRIELNQKEEILKKETERLKTLKKEVEDDITKYTALLEQIDKSLKQAEEIGNKRLKHVAKAYEAMQPEDAASRISGLDNDMAVQILLKMESKKAGLVIGMMGAQRATVLTKEIAKLKM